MTHHQPPSTIDGDIKRVCPFRFSSPSDVLRDPPSFPSPASCPLLPLLSFTLHHPRPALHTPFPTFSSPSPLCQECMPCPPCPAFPVPSPSTSRSFPHLPSSTHLQDPSSSSPPSRHLFHDDAPLTWCLWTKHLDIPPRVSECTSLTAAVWFAVCSAAHCKCLVAKDGCICVQNRVFSAQLS